MWPTGSGQKGAKCGQLDFAPSPSPLLLSVILPASIISRFAVLSAFVLLFFARHYFDFNILFVCFPEILGTDGTFGQDLIKASGARSS